MPETTEDEGRLVYPLRIPRALKARAEALAGRRGTSLNALIVTAVDEYLTADERGRPSPDSASTRGTRSPK